LHRVVPASSAGGSKSFLLAGGKLLALGVEKGRGREKDEKKVFESESSGTKNGGALRGQGKGDEAEGESQFRGGFGRVP